MPSPLRPLLLLALLASASARAQDRIQLENRSSHPWTLALAEGARPGLGSLSLLDKFTGRVLAVLSQVGESLTLAPQGKFLVIFNRSGGYLYRDFLVKDKFGYYAEYVASVEFLSSPRISIQLVDQHVGPPMDRTDDGTIKQFLADAISVGSENIIIHPNSLKQLHSADPSSAISSKFAPMPLPTN